MDRWLGAAILAGFDTLDGRADGYRGPCDGLRYLGWSGGRVAGFPGLPGFPGCRVAGLPGIVILMDSDTVDGRVDGYRES